MAFVGLCATSLFAQLPSRITVFSEDGNPFYLVLNGIKQNDKPLTNVLVDGLTLPTYKVRVMFENAAIPAIDKTIYTKDVDNIPSEASYRIKKNNKGIYVMNLFTTQPIAQPITYTQQTVPADMAVISFRSTETTNNTVMMGSSVTTTTTTVGTPGMGASVNVIDPVTGEHISVNAGINMGMGGASVTSTTTTTTTTTGSGNVGYVAPPTQQGCMYPMQGRDFETAKTTIRGQSFEDTKLSTAKNIANSNCLSAQQVKEICQLFSFEESKLDFAKFAYTRCTERNNYFLVNDVFSFSSSSDELNAFINGGR